MKGAYNNLTIRAICPGFYEVTVEGIGLYRVTRIDEGPLNGKWIAQADFDACIYTDPTDTKAEQIENLRYSDLTWIKNERKHRS